MTTSRRLISIKFGDGLDLQNRVAFAVGAQPGNLRRYSVALRRHAIGSADSSSFKTQADNSGQS